jgi:hypothetical protein
MKWTPISVEEVEVTSAGDRTWRLSDPPPQEWRAAFNDGVGAKVTGPVDGSGPRLNSEAVVWREPPVDAEAAYAIVKAWVDASNRAYEALVVEPANKIGASREGN